MTWNVEKSAELYGIEKWGNPYFTTNKDGNIQVQLPSSKNSIDLFKLTEDLVERGLRAPILVRFPDIMKERVH